MRLLGFSIRQSMFWALTMCCLVVCEVVAQAPDFAPDLQDVFVEKTVLSITLDDVTVYGDAYQRRLRKLEGELFTKAELKAAIDEVLTELLEQYRNDGYRYAKVSEFHIRGEESSSGQFYPRIVISEGRIRDIRVEGAQRTRSDVILRQLLLAPGDIYREDDKEESERLLRTRPYIGSVTIESEADDQNNVSLVVHIQDLWSVVPRVRFVGGNNANLKDVLDGNVGVQASVLDYNLFGSGQSFTARYRWDIREQDVDGTPLTERRGRHLLGFHLVEPNLFQSRWQMETRYQQLSQTDFDSWEFRLSHPFYSLKTRWSFDIHGFETASVDGVYFNSELLRTWERSIAGQYLNATRAYGPPNKQVRHAFWLFHQETDYKLRYSKLPVTDRATAWASVKESEQFRVSPASLPTERQMLVGSDVTWQQVRYVEESELDRLGRVEDVPLGQVATLSLGAGLRGMENDHDEIRPGLYTYFLHRGKSRWLWHGQLTGTMPYVVRNEAGERDGWKNHLWQFQTRLFLRPKHLPTVLLRAETASASRTTNDFELFLDNATGVRGYPRYSFDGMHRLVFNVEARQTFYRHRWGVLQGAAFADRGYIWRDAFTPPKRSVGLGLRVGLLRFAESPILRLDAVYPLDKRTTGWALSFGTGQYF